MRFLHPQRACQFPDSPFILVKRLPFRTGKRPPYPQPRLGASVHRQAQELRQIGGLLQDGSAPVKSGKCGYQGRANKAGIAGYLLCKVLRDE